MTEQVELSISIDALKAGNKAEFAKLVNQYSNSVYRIALKILSDPSDAEDVLQETFIKAFRALPGFEGRSSISTWLFRIATNEALMLVRKRKPEFMLVDEPDAPDEEENSGQVQLTDWCCMPEAELMSDESRRHLEEAVQDLTPALRAVFVLRDIEGLSIKETAEALDVSEQVVKTRLLRARLRLREDLSRYFGGKMAERLEK
ncbi:MAG: sigma-70 family RNA polymerase sigma factor [Chloroflexi bacterium]|nr:sigma-70 family RNA polymerase sigma factor [Chloroflexota bacterium]